MSAEKLHLDFLPQWVLDRKPLTLEEVAKVTTFSVYTLREMRKEGVICAILGKKPYRFDPVHIYNVFFGHQKPEARPGSRVRSLKTEKGNSHNRKPANKRELWL